jgi:FixJ family two-component response regulator
VEKHRARIMYKMGTDRLADLVRMAVQIEADRR